MRAISQKVYCAVCKQTLDPEDAAQVAPNVYCCQIHVHEWTCRQRDKEEKRKRKEKEERDYQLLVETICFYYNVDELTSLMKRQIKDFKRDYQYTYSGIRGTIDYCFRLVEPPLVPMVNAGLGIVPYYYEKAKEFYCRRREIRRQMQSLEVEDVGQKRVVVIQAADLEESKRRNNMIDIEALEDDNDQT